LEMLLKIANVENSYPRYVLSGAKNAAVFFCAAFWGRQDVVYFCDAGVKNVTLVDSDARKMALLKKIYPANWGYEVRDAFELVGELRERGRRYDVVSADCWAHDVKLILINDFGPFYDITGKYLVSTVSFNNFFKEYGIRPSEAALSDFMSAKHGVRIRVIELLERSGFDDRCYWAVMAK
jgi:hypothetical protein